MTRIFVLTAQAACIATAVMVGIVGVGQLIKRLEAASVLEACRAAPSPAAGQECK